MESTRYALVDPTEENAVFEKRKKSWLGRNEKWRRGILYASLATSIVCLLNLVITIWAVVTHGATYGSAVLYEGSCETTKNLNIGVHLIINIFSSAILGGSNYAMQCLSSPTRSEVDDAHARGTWLDIGVPSIRNLRSIARKRFWVWLFLVVSSIPLHLFYNSVVFTTLSGNSYIVYTVNEAWLSSGNFYVPDYEGYGPYVYELLDKELWKANEAGSLERLEPSSCIDVYARSFISTRGNLLVVTSSPSNSSSSSEEGEIFDYTWGGEITITGGQDATNLDPYAWICSDSRECLNWVNGSTTVRCDEYAFCDAPAVRKNPGTWTLNGRQVDYCLSAKTDEHCKLRLNTTIAALVIITGFIKALLIIITFFSVKEKLLLSTGDAIVSFLSRPDPVTQGSSLLSKADITHPHKSSGTPFGPQTYQPSRNRWLAAASRRRTATVFTTAALGLLICTALLIYATQNMKGAKASEIWALGFGQPTQHTLITFAGIRRRMIRPAGLLSNVLIANAPQAILSFVYFSCNALLTAMLGAREWASYAAARKGLRVHAHPRGAQRATYFLQLPWRYSVPMVGVGAVLHWLASQSIFVVTVEWWTNLDPDVAEETGKEVGEWGRDDWHDFATCGYSPLALLIFVVVAAVFFGVVVAMGRRGLGKGMPVVGSCSLGIAAACHADRGGEGGLAGEARLKWGAVEWVGEGGDLVRRCGFSSGEVGWPVEGVVYS
ncbi:hypothetical protein BS50DRAFT_557431 [Corynespora cassiicola Philippines]|uniref:DUF6536 domain-containing protein n=1 Tax=Corynespora cassiicola Philippines TaxID=1448308 RepID=A0A2T2NH21_CORCC|nr:hypothetical protein BS50DRAFT_557431 [Corynespora cassiicola Philippines]